MRLVGIGETDTKCNVRTSGKVLGIKTANWLGNYRLNFKPTHRGGGAYTTPSDIFCNQKTTC